MAGAPPTGEFRCGQSEFKCPEQASVWRPRLAIAVIMVLLIGGGAWFWLELDKGLLDIGELTPDTLAAAAACEWGFWSVPISRLAS